MSGSTDHVALTSIDLDAFFEDRHRALAAQLEGIAKALQCPPTPPGAVTVGRPGTDAPAAHRTDAATVAATLGREHGLYEHLIPPTAGGASGGRTDEVDVRSLVLIREALGFASPLADAIFAVQGLGIYSIAVAGTAAQKTALSEFVSGRRIAAFALTEPEAGSDVASLRTEARRDGNKWVLDGEKTLISNAPIADVFVVFANANPTVGRRGISAFIVEADNPGLTQTAQPMSGDHPIGALHLANCKVDGSALLGTDGGGFALAMRTLGTFRISVGAAACGMAAAALEDAIVHVQRRVQFGKPLAEQQMVQAYIAEMATELDAARLLVGRAAYAKDLTNGRSTREVAMAKLFATEAAQRIIDKAVQLHGGRGVLSGTRVESLYRDIRPLRIYEGTSEIQKLIIARSFLSRN